MSDDQDTTAPGRVGITIKRVDVDARDDRDWIGDVLAGWWSLRLSANIEAAAWEEMRVRHTASRIAKVLAWGKLEEARALSKGLPYFVVRGEDDD